MTQRQKSRPSGELNGAGTGIPQGLQSSSAGNPSTLDMSGITLEVKSPKDSQLTPNSQENPNIIHIRMIMAFVSKLGELVQVRNVTLADGRKGWMIFFPSANFEIDPVSKSLRPR